MEEVGKGFGRTLKGVKTTVVCGVGGEPPKSVMVPQTIMHIAAV